MVGRFGQSLMGVIDRMNFTPAYQLEFIDLLESFEGERLQDRLQKLRNIYFRSFGKSCVQIKVCDSLLVCSKRGNFDAGLVQWLTPEYLLFYRVAQYAEDTAGAMEEINARLVEEKEVFKKAFVTGLITPLLVFVVSLVGIMVVYAFLTPIFSEALNRPDLMDELPRPVVYLGGFIESFWYVVLGVSVGIRIAFVKLREGWIGEDRDEWSKRFPLVIYRAFQSARLLNILGVMLQSEMTLLEVLTKIKPWLNPYLQWHVSKMIEGLVRGKRKEDYFGIGIFSERQLIRLSGGRTVSSDESFSQALQKMSRYALKDAVSATNVYSRNVKIVLFVIAIVLVMIFMQGFGGIISLIE